VKLAKRVTKVTKSERARCNDVTFGTPQLF
jgi:hypothetical protein